MARFRPALGSISGSWADLTATQGNRGAFIRRRPKPTSPTNQQPYRFTSSAPLEANKTVFANVARTWRTLTDAQRAVWNTYAASNLITTRDGSEKRLSGFGAYCAINTRFAFRSGFSAPLAAPIAPGPLPLILLNGLVMHRTGIYVLTFSIPAGPWAPTTSRVSIFLSRPGTETQRQPFQESVFDTRLSVSTVSPFTRTGTVRRTYPVDSWVTLWAQFDWRGANTAPPVSIRTRVIA